ncbi:MAG: peptide chain release factor N(5)-glutamine methyltransferase [Lachnospiraceae bacterium]|nr:peptide chain release factor N(5)-glutamine methyltransferase [Lachnospiraceae bacterium]
MTYVEAYDWGKNCLAECQVPDAEWDAWLLLEYVTGMKRAEYLLRQGETMDGAAEERYHFLIQQRETRIPLQHLTGEVEFMGLSFSVNQNVLIPRQDTETLVELVLPVIEGKRVLDVCTGSGCIAIALQKLGNPAVCHGVDLSPQALAVAQDNCKQLGAEVEMWQSDLFAQVTESYDVITSNPPYIASAVIPELMPEVREHEPMIALDGGIDGCLFYRRLAAEAGRYLQEGGRLYLEIGYDQGETVANMLRENGFEEVRIHQDLAGNDRVLSAVWHV